jgi:uncharacterized membrane protein
MATTTVPEFTPADIEEGKSLAWLAYLGILFLIPMLAKPENKFCKTHAKQGMVMAILAVILAVCSFVSVIPFVGWCLGVVVFLGLLTVLIFDIIALVNAAQGQFYKIPVVGDFSLKLNF